MQVAQEDQKTFTDLVRQLVGRCATDVEKARTIFRWITVKNLNNIQFDDNLRGDSPLGLLRGIKHGTESYHVLFKRLCRWVACKSQSRRPPRPHDPSTPSDYLMTRSRVEKRYLYTSGMVSLDILKQAGAIYIKYQCYICETITSYLVTPIKLNPPLV